MESLLLAPDLFSQEGGIARILRLYLKALCESANGGDHVRFVSLNDTEVDTTELRRYSNEHLADWIGCSRKKLRFANAALRMGKSSDQIICGHIAQLPLAWALSKIRPRLRYYLVAHGIEVWRPFTFLERKALLGATCIFCVSDFTRREVLRNCAVTPDRIAVLHNALDPHLESPREIGEPAAPPTMLLVSRLSIADNYKGVGHLIKAMPEICAGIPGARLRIVGRGDGLPGLQALSRKLDLGNAVEFAGYRDDTELREDFARCSLFALPSEREGFGLVYLEAMAQGRPCLGARSGGTPEVITEETGVLVDYGDVPGIASAAKAALRRRWAVEPILQRALHFSYERFRERLGELLAAENPGRIPIH